jgi:hypothetical protein
MVDPVTVKGGLALAKLTLGKALMRWKDHANRNTEAIREAAAADGRQWRAERDRLVERRLAELESTVDQHLETAETVALAVEQLLGDQQFFRLERNYEFEAAREATEQRRRMLAFASAWSVDPDLSIAQLARVERTIRELDPDDIAVLKHLADLQPPAVAESPLPLDHPDRNRDLRDRATSARLKHQNTLFVHWNESRPRGEVLSAAGCVLLSPGVPVAGGTSTYLQITQVGFNLLRVLDGYIRSNAPDDAPKESSP